MAKTYFWKGVLLGAVAGGALSLLDRNTRQKVASNCQKATENMSYYVKNPKEAVNQVQEVTGRIKAAYEEISDDLSFITETVEDLKEGTPQIASLLGGTKEAFFEEEDELA